jgi:hypothetical protein
MNGFTDDAGALTAIVAMNSSWAHGPQVIVRDMT